MLEYVQLSISTLD